MQRILVYSDFCNILHPPESMSGIHLLKERLNIIVLNYMRLD